VHLLVFRKMKVCLLLLLVAWSSAIVLEEPYVVFAQSVRKPKSLDQTAEYLRLADNSSEAEKEKQEETAGILFGLKEAEHKIEEERRDKSLINSFPFNQAKHAGHDEGQVHHHAVNGDHGGHGEHVEHAEHVNHGDHKEQDQHFPSELGDFNIGEAQLPLRQQLSNRDPSLGQSSLRTRPTFGNVGRPFRQGETDVDDPTQVSLNTVITAGDADGGRKCVDKVMMVEETMYDDMITCDHSYDKRCHTSYVTSYESQQEEECEENFRKTCLIDYEDLAYNSTVEICRTPLVKDCDIPGETVCQTVYESECATVQRVHEVEDDVTSCKTENMKKCKEVTEGYTTKEECDEWPVQRCQVEKKKVKKYTPETKCYKEPRELCAPRGCGFRNGALECHNKVKTVVVENPVETCDMEPVRTCKHVTKLVPKLVPVEECVDVPKEICTRSKTNPRKIKKPVVKKWCYVPSLESGLL